MKKILLILLLSISHFTLRAHDHLEIYLDSANGNRLAAFGNLNQTATYFPLGETPNPFDLYAFPGGNYATELTFSAFENISFPAEGTQIRIDILSVAGPAGGVFSFWDIGTTSPTWSRPSGWASSPSDHPGFIASEDETGGHIHGRAFSTTKPGVYDVTFQAVDELGNYPSSLPFVVRFTAMEPPKLSIRIENNSAKVSFVSRSNYDYDVQKSTTLQPNSWTTTVTLEGTGGALEYSEPLGGQPRVFYRIVEY
jgi:hypothetical protein